MGMFFHSADEAPERPAAPAVRRANLRRVRPLFRPYWPRLSGLLPLIAVSAVVGMLVLNWKLALFALALIPIFAVLTRRVGNERRRIAKTTQESLADISSQVQESLSVSGIMLGKTMGRAAELGDRFESESLRLADLQVRQRMAGRWVMASIQTSFSIMPAAVYWLGGTVFSGSISIATIVAFTTLQTRLFFPVGSLLGVGLEIQTSLALFDRIFEYL